MVCPDLNEDDLEGLTTTRALRLATGLALEMDPPLLVFGSSFGGRVAARVAEALPDRVAGLVLMAPAFFLQKVWSQALGAEDLERWRQRGALPVDHPALGANVSLGVGLLEDSASTDGFPALPHALPVLLFHGKSDEVVSPEDSRRFARAHPGTRLIALDSDHSLGDCHEQMWEEILPFVKQHLG